MKTTIRFRASLAIDMRRLLSFALLLLLLLSLAACHREDEQNVFVMGNGGCTDTETGVLYLPLSPAFEPIKSQGTRGVLLDEEGEITRTFLGIPDLDSRLWLCDDLLTVWYAGTPIDPATLTPRALLVCQETSFSQEITRFTVGTDDAVIDEILSLWRTGEATSEPGGELTDSRRLKLISAELLNIYYCIDFCVWDDRQGYLYDRYEGRIVALPQTLTELLSQ